MRITLIAMHFAEYACRLAEALAHDHEVQLLLGESNVASELENEFDRYRSIPQLTIVTLPHSKSPILWLQNAIRLAKEVKRFNPDVVHQQENTRDYEVAALLYWSRFFPFVLTVHDPQPHSGEDSHRLKFSRHRIYQWILRKLCDSAITHGNLLCEQLVTVAPWLTGRVSNIPHGPIGPTQLLKQKLPESGTLLFFGRINAYKGLRYFIEAILHLRAKGLEVKGVIAGRGGDLAPNRAAIESNDCFELHEEFVSRAKVHVLFTRAQLVIMPYIDATQSGVAAMAIGFGRPVVATRVGAIPEMVQDGYTGLLVPPRDAVALADAIESLLSDPDRYAMLTDNVQAAGSHGDLSWKSIARATSAVYSETIARRMPLLQRRFL
ncbi:MAG: glycosyltransferase family 4 protein [Methylococcaceae bacterium]